MMDIQKQPIPPCPLCKNMPHEGLLAIYCITGKCPLSRASFRRAQWIDLCRKREASLSSVSPTYATKVDRLLEGAKDIEDWATTMVSLLHTLSHDQREDPLQCKRCRDNAERPRNLSAIIKEYEEYREEANQ